VKGGGRATRGSLWDKGCQMASARWDYSGVTGMSSCDGNGLATCPGLGDCFSRCGYKKGVESLKPHKGTEMGE